MYNWWENTWSKDLRRETQRYERNTNREYKTDLGLWRNQASGSYEAQYVREKQLFDSIAEYERMNEWN